MPKQIVKNATEKMGKGITAYSKELSKVSVGRANPAILERVTVDYYGSPTPINQVANISVPEARLLAIQPYDKTIIGAIEKAILKADLGINPSNDGTLIRIIFQPLTEERRKEIAKEVKKMSEDAKVAVRNVRRDANEELKRAEKNGDITEDDLRGYADDVQKETDKHIVKVDEITKNKEKEIMSV